MVHFERWLSFPGINEIVISRAVKQEEEVDGTKTSGVSYDGQMKD